ncbi:MAG: sugar phosphate isomerase/epimerase [Nitrososphaerota archaeon]|nr:sugar phosphate isomerase/epimerase [Nitrososphaerota archaeon]
MKLGVSTWSLLGMDVYSAVKVIGDAGIEYVELWGELPHAYPGWADKKLLWDALSPYGMTVTVHAPFTDLNPAAPDAGVRAAIAKALVAFVEFSASLGASMVTVHPGSVHNEKLVAGSAAAAAGTIQEMLTAAGGRLTVNVENQTKSAGRYHYPLGSTPESLEDLLGRLEGARGTVDTGHAHASGIDPMRMLDRLGPKLAEVHLSDNSGTLDDHLIPGRGNAPLNEFMRRLAKSDTLVCLELNPHVYSREEVLAGVESTRAAFGQLRR